jgi:hypothetical protein
MTFQDAVAQQQQWVQLWLNWMLVGIFILPLALLIWRQTRITALVTLAGVLIAGFGTNWIFNQLGYVKMLGLPHVIVWTPLAYYLYLQIKRADMPKWPRWIMMVILATILISLAFDYTDTIRYILGERTPLAKPVGS